LFEARRLVVSSVGRAIGLDVDLEFCEVAVCEDGQVRSAGRVEAKPDALEALAASLLPTDRVALQVTGSSWEIVRNPRAARREGGRGEPWRYGDLARASEDRPA
jgi:hypothetical protein